MTANYCLSLLQGLKMIEMASLITKFQRCGKPNCRCSSSGPLHGPYFWLVSYSKPVSKGEKGKYRWKYLGKNPKAVMKNLRNYDPESADAIDEKFLRTKMLELTQKSEENLGQTRQKTFSQKIYPEATV